MKISTLRTSLFLANALIVAGIAYVVFQGFQEKNRRPEELRQYKQRVTQSMQEARGAGAGQGSGRREYPALGSISLQGEPPRPVAPVPEAPAAAKAVAPPLDTQITILGLEVGRNTSEPSFVFYYLGSGPPASPAVPAAPPGRPPMPPRPGVPVAAGAEERPFVAYEGAVVELGNGFEARVKAVSTSEVLFDYDGKEVALSVKAPDPSSTPPGARPAGSTAALGPISNDPGVWISWNPARPSDGIAITEMGARAFQQKGEAVLDGVRFESEVVHDGRPAVKLSHIPRDSVLRKAGAEDNDVVTHINGTRVSSKGDIIRYVKENPNMAEYRVTFLRRGSPYSRVVRPPR